MPNINVRGISVKTKEALRVRAAKAGISLESYARRALQKASMGDVQEPTPLLELAKKYFGSENGVELDLPERSTHREPVEFNRAP